MKAFASLLGIALVSTAAASAQHSQAPLTVQGGQPASATAAKEVSVPSNQPATASIAVPAPSPTPTASTRQPSTPVGVPAHFGPGAKLFLQPMNGFETYLAGAILKKKVPVVVVDDPAKADFIVTGVSDEAKAGWAKTIFVSPASHAQASISVKDAHTGNLVFAYNVDKFNAARANQSTAEACAKHLKEALEKK